MKDHPKGFGLWYIPCLYLKRLSFHVVTAFNQRINPFERHIHIGVDESLFICQVLLILAKSSRMIEEIKFFIAFAFKLV